MRVVVGGSSGFLGTALVERLRSAGHQVTRLVRRPPAGPDEVRWRPNEAELDPAVLDGVDVAVNLAGVGVGDHRWNKRYKQLIRSSRLNATGALARAMAAAADPPSVLVNVSAAGYYGNRGEEELTESSPPGDTFLADLCVAWEAATSPATAAGVRVVLLRTGLVVGPNGGLLKPMLLPYRLGLGFRLGSGKQWWPWVSLADWLGSVEFVIGTGSVAGPVNMSGPAPVRNAEFARTFGKGLHRPAALSVPSFALRLGLGEFATESLASQRMVPAALTAAGFKFTHPDLESALRWAVAPTG
jgi:uncharacterized protein (TIGR01777 family)